MPNQQLLDYVNQRKAAGATTEVIKGELLKSGWPMNDVNIALGIAPTPAPAPIPVPAPAPAPSANYGAPVPSSAPVPPPGTNPAYGAPGTGPNIGAQMQGMVNGVAQMTGSSASPHLAEIIKGITMWNVISGVIYAGANYLASMFLFRSVYYYGYSSGWSGIVSILVGSLIGGVIAGFVIAMWWRPIFNFFHGITGGWLNTPFKLFFYPVAVLMILPSLPALAVIPVYTLISVGGLLVARYLFAINADKIVRTYIG